MAASPPPPPLLLLVLAWPLVTLGDAQQQQSLWVNSRGTASPWDIAAFSSSSSALRFETASTNQPDEQQPLWEPPAWMRNISRFESAIPMLVIRPSSWIADEPKRPAYAILSSCGLTEDEWAEVSEEQRDGGGGDGDDDNDEYTDLVDAYYYGSDEAEQTEAQRAVAAAKERARKLTEEGIYGGAYKRREGVQCTLGDGKAPLFEGIIGIELRGRSSSENEKKSYNIELWDADTVEQAAAMITPPARFGAPSSEPPSRKAPLLGMPEDPDWVLYGPFLDRSLIRTPAGMHIWRAAGHWAPRTRPVELFLHAPPPADDRTPIDLKAHYVGVYMLMEKIKRDKRRLDVTEINEDDPDPANHGYILEIPSEYPNRPNPRGTFVSPVTGVKWAPVYPKPKDFRANQSAYISEYLGDFETALFDPSFRHPRKGLSWTHWVDLFSFADYVLHTELIRNVDGYIWSVFVHKDRAGAQTADRGRLQLGPPWDLNMAMSNAQYNYATRPEGWHFRFTTETLGRHVTGPLRTDRMERGKVARWIARMLRDERFERGIKRRWRDLRRGAWSDERLAAAVSDAAAPLRLRTRGATEGGGYGAAAVALEGVFGVPDGAGAPTGAAERNYKRWDIGYPERKPRVSVHVPIVPVGFGGGWENEVERVRTFLLARAAWIDSQLLA